MVFAKVNYATRRRIETCGFLSGRAKRRSSGRDHEYNHKTTGLLENSMRHSTGGLKIYSTLLMAKCLMHGKEKYLSDLDR